MMLSRMRSASTRRHQRRVFLARAGPEKFVSRRDADVIAHVIRMPDFFHPVGAGRADNRLEVVPGAVRSGAVPVFDARARPFGVAAAQDADALAALLHASLSLVEHHDLPA